MGGASQSTSGKKPRREPEYIEERIQTSESKFMLWEDYVKTWGPTVREELDHFRVVMHGMDGVRMPVQCSADASSSAESSRRLSAKEVEETDDEYENGKPAGFITTNNMVHFLYPGPDLEVATAGVLCNGDVEPPTFKQQVADSGWYGNWRPLCDLRESRECDVDGRVDGVLTTHLPGKIRAAAKTKGFNATGFCKSCVAIFNDRAGI